MYKYDEETRKNVALGAANLKESTLVAFEKL